MGSILRHAPLPKNSPPTATESIEAFGGIRKDIDDIVLIALSHYAAFPLLDLEGQPGNQLSAVTECLRSDPSETYPTLHVYERLLRPLS